MASSCCLWVSFCSWLASLTFSGWWLAECPAGQFLEDYHSRVWWVQRYWFPACAGCLSCQSKAWNSGMSLGVHWQHVLLGRCEAKSEWAKHVSVNDSDSTIVSEKERQKKNTIRSTMKMVLKKSFLEYIYIYIHCGLNGIHSVLREKFSHLAGTWYGVISLL